MWLAPTEVVPVWWMVSGLCWDYNGECGAEYPSHTQGLKCKVFKQVLRNLTGTETDLQKLHRQLSLSPSGRNLTDWQYRRPSLCASFSAKIYHKKNFCRCSDYTNNVVAKLTWDRTETFHVINVDLLDWSPMESQVLEMWRSCLSEEEVWKK